MNFGYYTGKPENYGKNNHIKLPFTKRTWQDDPRGYIAEQGLVDAVNVAILLGQPLLVTGEPGTGKTQLAYSVATELGFDSPLKFETKSTSSARDLFYTYDTVGRFHAAQTGDGSGNSLDYVTYNALGIAILLANEEKEVSSSLPKGFKHKGPRRSVVLIDEIDKAPRDFPNDILNEIEGMYFKVPELNNMKISADTSMRPLVVITSNSEKHLPDAFLRRCVYYHIHFPDKDRLHKLLEVRVGKYLADSSEFLKDVIDLFYTLRDNNSGLRKKPATAELLGWIIALKEMRENESTPVRKNKGLLRSSLSVLIKSSDDLNQAHTVLNEWMRK